MQIFKIIEEAQSFFAIAPRPAAEHLREEMLELKESGVDVVVSLIEAHEVETQGLQGEAEVSDLLGLGFIHRPLEDRQPPGDIDVFLDTVKCVLDHLEAGRSVTAHCVGGIGRSGMLAAAVLLNRNIPIDSVFQRIATARGRKAPDTPAQIRWFYDNVERIRMKT